MIYCRLLCVRYRGVHLLYELTIYTGYGSNCLRKLYIRQEQLNILEKPSHLSKCDGEDGV